MPCSGSFSYEPINAHTRIRIRDALGSLYGDLPQIGGHKHCKIISSLSLFDLDRRPATNVQCSVSNVQRPTSDIRRPETTITTDNNRCRSPEIFHKMSLRSRRPRVPNPQSTCAQPKRHTDSDLSLFAYISWT